MAVWHDKLGTNLFLGEVNIDMGRFNTTAPEKIETYTLMAKVSEAVVLKWYSFFATFDNSTVLMLMRDQA